MNLRELSKKINIKGTLLYNEPMSLHTSFKIGGPADIFFKPEDTGDLKTIFSFCLSEGLPYFILGAGANILVSDKGIRGTVIDMSEINSISIKDTSLCASAGLPISRASEIAGKRNLSGMEFIYSMPGSVGGSLWMNARCYGKSVSEILVSAELLTDKLEFINYKAGSSEFGYKISPFQRINAVITKAVFNLKRGEYSRITSKMREIEKDRRSKGHFLFPSAGSVFKNNRSFGTPTGKIIEKAGLKGFSLGGAKISDFHANIIINAGNAKADDVLRLIEIIEERVFERFGFKLEREIILAGEWQKGRRE
ncbi:MAG: UDP-N-acetylmuramate dehydrogenase [Spirochaetales bacterium]|nr:UDP-N-acetylmuramate dehydrogenase [Spirochaetales bacterium]